MKIGLMTFHTVVNYGGVLQAYALQQTLLKRYSAQTEIIHYDSAHFKSQYRPINRYILRHPKSIFKKLSQTNVRRIRRTKFRSFVNRRMLLSGEPLSRRRLKQIDGRYDCLITGSDQVWNFSCTGNDASYFLDFAKNGRKFSYAASFGRAELAQDERERIREYLADFSGISVREKSGQAIIRELLNREVPVVPDPTLLLDAEQWRNLEQPYRVEGDYILLISIGMLSEDMRAFARRLDGSMKLVYINLFDPMLPGMRNVRDASPEEYLYLVDHARYVVTNSFHGCVFSVLFHKEFYYEMSKTSKANTRLDNFADMLDVRHRRTDAAISTAPLDYDRLDGKLAEMRETGVAYLDTILREPK